MEKLTKYQKYIFRITDRNLSRLIENIEININMALLQSERILEDNASIDLPRVTPGPDQVLFLKLFSDIHFYLVSVDNARKSIDRLNEVLNGNLDEIKSTYEEFFNSTNAARRCQEHLDQRIESGEYFGKSLYDNWVYEICGNSVIIGPPAAKKLIELYRSIDTILEPVFPKKGEEVE